jgi:hypothetical protein
MSAQSVVAADELLQIGHAGVCRPHTGEWPAMVICSRPFKSFVQGGPMPIRLLLEHDHSLAPDEVTNRWMPESYKPAYPWRVCTVRTSHRPCRPALTRALRGSLAQEIVFVNGRIAQVIGVVARDHGSVPSAPRAGPRALP